MRSLFWIVAALIVGIGLFMLLNKGGLKNLGKEFTGALGEENKEDSGKGDQTNNKNDGESS
jgi:hypothetical protein